MNVSLVARKNTPAARSGRPRIPADKEKAVVDFIQDRQLRFYAETLSENQRKAAIKYKIAHEPPAESGNDDSLHI